jgi:type 1 glutamine amidotransferase
MRPLPRSLAWLLATVVVASAGSTPSRAVAAQTSPAAGQPLERVLVFSRTAGFRHLSIPTGVQTITELGAENGFAVDATEDPSLFTRANLRGYDVVLFVNTTGTILDKDQKRALRRYVEKGGGYMGIHSAADTEHEWPFYERLVGALFLSHPLQQLATFHNEGLNHPATAHIGESTLVFDEFYSFKSNPRPRVRVLLTIDEGTYLPDPNTSYLVGAPVSGTMGDHPMSWCHDVRKGRSFYTALGHEAHLYAEGWYRRHLLGGLLTAARAVKANCRPG